MKVPEENKKYCVYMHTNKINNKKYIGLTSQVPEKRWGKDGKNYVGCSKFIRAIEKYGWNNFDHDIVKDDLTKEEAENLENKLIEKYNTTNDQFGYNLSSGGNAPIFNEETKIKRSIPILCIETGEKFYGITEASNKTGIEKANILACCRGVNHTAGGYHWRYFEQNKHDPFEEKIKMLELNNPVQKIVCVETESVYNSIVEAANSLQINSSHISSCLKGTRKTCGGYHWKYYNEELNKSLNQKIVEQKAIESNKEIVCLETSVRYKSCRAAEKQTGIDESTIKSCCDHIFRTAGGYHWEYANSQTEENFISIRERSKKIICLETLEIFENATDAQNKTGINKTSVRKCCRGEYKTAGKNKKHFKYYYDYCVANKKEGFYNEDTN